MKARSRRTPEWLAVGAIMALVVDFLLVLPHVLGQQVEWQTANYGILAVAGAFVFAALVELRIDTLDRKLDELLKAHSS